jgi:hypothetical protein
MMEDIQSSEKSNRLPVSASALIPLLEISNRIHQDSTQDSNHESYVGSSPEDSKSNVKGSPEDKCEKSAGLKKLLNFLLAPIEKFFHFLLAHMEWAAFILSTLSFIGLIALLWKVDNKPQPSWTRLSISLNSVISWISTVAKFELSILIGSGIGQLKWIWFAKQENALSFLQAFDSAKDPVGAATLLWKLRLK